MSSPTTTPFRRSPSPQKNIAKDIATGLLATNDPKDLSHLVSRINNKVRRNLLDPAVLKTTTALFHPFGHQDHRYYRPTIHDYNTVILNQTIFHAMLQTGQSTPLRAHCLEFLKNTDSPRVIAHPGEIIKEVKEHLNLTPAQWRYFCRAATNLSAHDISPWRRDPIALTSQALVDANRPHATNAQLNIAWNRHRDHKTFANTPWEMGNPWKAWTGVLNHYLDDSDYMRLTKDPDYIVDALRYHVQHQLPWGPGNWDTLTARSQRWHLEHFGHHPRNNYYILPTRGRRPNGPASSTRSQ